MPITPKAEDYFDFFYYYFQRKTSLDISCESSEARNIKTCFHMKYQDLFSLEKKKKFRMSSDTNFAWRFKG